MSVIRNINQESCDIRLENSIRLPFALPIIQGKKMKKKCCKKFKKGKRCKRCPGNFKK